MDIAIKSTNGALYGTECASAVAARYVLMDKIDVLAHAD